MESFSEMAVPLKYPLPADHKSGSLFFCPENLCGFLSSDICFLSSSVKEGMDETSIVSQLATVGSSVSFNKTHTALSSSSSSDAGENPILGRRSWQEAFPSAQPCRQMLPSIDHFLHVQQCPPVNCVIPCLRTGEQKFQGKPGMGSQLKERDFGLPHVDLEPHLPTPFELFSDSGIHLQNLPSSSIFHQMNIMPGMSCSTSHAALQSAQFPESNAARNVPKSPMSYIETATAGFPILENFQTEQMYSALGQRNEGLSLQNRSHCRSSEESAADSAQSCASVQKEWLLNGDSCKHNFMEKGDHPSRKRHTEDQLMETLPHSSKRAHVLQESNQITQISGTSWTCGTPFKAGNKTGYRSCKSSYASKHEVGPALNTNLKPRAKQGSLNDPQIVAARQRRERINARLKILQELVPNGSKVDLITMLEKAINYVKFLQLQVKVLSNDEYWPNQKEASVPFQVDQRRNGYHNALTTNQANQQAGSILPANNAHSIKSCI